MADDNLLMTAAQIAYNAAVELWIAFGKIERDGALWFYDLDESERAQVVAQVQYTIEHRIESADVRHGKQLRALRRAGWTYGAELDASNQRSPLCREWAELDSADRHRMRLFVAICNSLV
jgi:hypothetical protein